MLLLRTAVNSDGRSVMPITVPSQAMQEAMLRDVYMRAEVDPHSVQYVEAHAPGTSRGDPVEALAIGHVFGEGRTAGTYICIVLNNY